MIGKTVYTTLLFEVAVLTSAVTGQVTTPSMGIFREACVWAPPLK